jgi:hypothetical protein
MSDLYVEVEEYIRCTDLSFEEISKTLDIPLEWVYDVAQMIGEFDE